VHSSCDHINFINKFGIIYSTSANLHKEAFNKDVAVEKSDIIVYTNEEFNNTKSSDIYKVSKSNIKKIR
jgi:tRNA A37 threonylcarbamoyladenosine synthetase subunit TsaC/SUA5/YrdC